MNEIELTKQLETYKMQCLELMKFQEEVEKVLLENGTINCKDGDYTIYTHKITKENNPKLHALCRKIVPIKVSQYYDYPSIEDVKYWIYALNLKLSTINILVRNIETLKLPFRFHTDEQFYRWIIENDELKNIRQITKTKYQEIVEAAKRKINEIEVKKNLLI